MTSDASSGRETVVTDPGALAFMWFGFPVLGTGAGWLLKAIAGWVASLAWAPLQGPFKLVASVPEPQATIGALVVGAAAGLVFAYLGAQDNLTVTVSEGLVTLARGGSTQDIPRASVRTVFVDGKQLVLLGGTTEELAREASDLAANGLENAFVDHGYPWHAGGDPYHDDYRRWVDGWPGLPDGANALLKTRERALAKGDKDDLAELRAELARLGVVVRDERKHQYWRSTREAA